MLGHKELFDALVKLCEENEAFFYHDEVLKTERFRVFNNRSASYSDWLHPCALELRGITFKVDDQGNFHSLASRPFPKFFRRNENPFTMKVDFSETVAISEKIDGLFMSSLSLNDGVWLKAKESLVSAAARSANQLLQTDEYSDLLKFIKEQEENGFTVCLEYTDPRPDFRIVIGYDKPALTVLGIICRNTGNEADLHAFEDHPASNLFVNNLIEDVDDLCEFIEKIPLMKDKEGYVVLLSSGQRVKIKTDWYQELHQRRRRARARAGLGRTHSPRYRGRKRWRAFFRRLRLLFGAR